MVNLTDARGGPFSATPATVARPVGAAGPPAGTSAKRLCTPVRHPALAKPGEVTEEGNAERQIALGVSDRCAPNASET
jgi:hypothetical protein